MKHRVSLIQILMACAIILIVLTCSLARAAPPKKNVKSKFYNFNEQLIDGQIKKPTALYTSARERARFDRLLKLKKSFLQNLFKTSKESTFK
jgi:hypothetical protein